MRKQLDDIARWVCVDPRQDVGDVRDRVDAVLLAARDQRVENGEVVTLLLVAHEEEVLAAERNASKRRLRNVVIGWNRREAEKSSQLAEVPKDVADRTAHPRSRFE